MLSSTQGLLNELIASNTLLTIKNQNHDTDYNQLLEDIKELARSLCEYDQKAGTLALVVALWARDRRWDLENIEKQDIERYLNFLVTNPGKSIQ